jgi:non-heme chloroperoxidase
MRRCIVMIHGMWAGGWVWDDWAPILERRGYACLAPTLRYHDVSPRTPPDALGFASLLDYAHDLEREIDSLAEPPVLLGHSMGGILAQMLAARGRARAVALLSPMPPQGINVLSLASLRMFRRTLMSWGFWGRPTRPDFAAWSTSPVVSAARPGSGSWIRIAPSGLTRRASSAPFSSLPELRTDSIPPR